MDYFIQEGFLCRNKQLCIPRGLMREKLTQEQHNSDLGGHFGNDKSHALVEECYYLAWDWQEHEELGGEIHDLLACQG